VSLWSSIWFVSKHRSEFFIPPSSTSVFFTCFWDLD
jgi:hypothetical protein